MGDRWIRFGGVIAVGCLVSFGGFAWAAESEEGALTYVYLDGSGGTAVDQVQGSRARVLLADLRRVDEIPASATRASVPEGRRWMHRQPIGIRVPEGSEEGSREWLDAELIRRDDAQILLSHSDPIRRHYVVAGHTVPDGSGRPREPWMLVFTPEFLHARAEFQVQSAADEVSKLRLLEVAGIDSDRIYFKAASPDGREYLVSAAYSVESASDEAALRAGRDQGR